MAEYIECGLKLTSSDATSRCPLVPEDSPADAPFKHQPTRADHIRSMTDEELAGWVDKWGRATDDCDECPLSDNCPQARVGVTTLDWLEQPYEEAEDGENQTV